MSGRAISVENLSKRFRIGHQAGRRLHDGALREAIARGARNLARQAGDIMRGRQIVPGDEVEDFWALKDVSFEVKQGEVLGIIGKNGAGKSTLLKILSRITEPSEGRIVLRGRVASLLEVGTGFHPELSGRENIFLNGAILGMRRAEVARKFDEIVAFAGIETFLDTPLKRYSSGMQVRLAFAIAAHLESEILALDEVLAVGDAEFQKRCLGRMNDVARSGRTVLFVSHNMHAVEKQCDRVMCVDRGRVSGIHDDVREGIIGYLRGQDAGGNAHLWVNPGDQCANGYFVPQRLEVKSAGPRSRADDPFANRHPIVVAVEGDVRQSDPALNVGIAVYADDGELLFWTFMSDTAEEDWPKLPAGRVRLRTELPAHLLNEGAYRIEVIADLRGRYWLHHPGAGTPASVRFSIQGGLSVSPLWNQKRPGLLAPVLAWRNE